MASQNSQPKPQPVVHHSTETTLGSSPTPDVSSDEKSNVRGAGCPTDEKVSPPRDSAISGEDVTPDSRNEKAQATEETAGALSVRQRRRHDTILLVCVLVMLAWPWILWGVIRSLEGIKANNTLAKLVEKHPQFATFFVAVIGNIVCLIIDILFSLAIIRFAQEWVSRRQKVTAYHFSLFGAFRNQTLPWTMRDLKHLMQKNRWLPITLVVACILAFQLVPSSTTSLLLPIPFVRTVPVIGQEQDFSSNASDCRAWLDSNLRRGFDCDWHNNGGSSYEHCLGQNEVVDALATGRAGILSLERNSTFPESVSLSNLGAHNGVRFLGALPGILPAGTNGVIALTGDTVFPTIFNDTQLKEAILNYNYTLLMQGLTLNTTCMFENESPIRVFVDEDGDRYDYNATCPDGADFMDRNLTTFQAPNSQTTGSLAAWACRVPASDTSSADYHFYLQGRQQYGDYVGNITCVLSDVGTSVLPVLFKSNEQIFTIAKTTEIPVQNRSSVYAPLVELALQVLAGRLVATYQNYDVNLLAESVMQYGTKHFDIPPHTKDEKYLPLYAAMLQSIIQYEATYIRLIYSTLDETTPPPQSCTRQVHGSVNYTIIGWHARLEHIGLLMPLTIMNVVSVCIIVASMIMTRDILNQDLRMAQQIEPTSPWDQPVRLNSDGLEPAINRFSDRSRILPISSTLDALVN